MGRLPPLSAWALTLALVPLSAVSGTVAGSVIGYPDGEGIPGVQVLARDPQGASAAGLTDAEGTFLIEGVDSGLLRVQARPPDTMNRLGAYAGDVSAFCAAQVYPLDEAVDGLVIELPRGGTIEGVLTDSAGVSVPGAIIAQGVDTLNRSLTRRATADGDGIYVVHGLASWIGADGDVVPGAYRLSAALDGEPVFYSPGVWDIDGAGLVPAVREEATSVALQRPPGALLEGRVEDEDGAAFAGAELAILAGGYGVVWSGVTDSLGQWNADDVPGDPLTVRVRGGGSAERWYGGTFGAVGAEPVDGGSARDLGTLALTDARDVAVVLTGEGIPADLSGVLTLSAESPLRSQPFAAEAGQGVAAGLPHIAIEGLLRIPGWLDASFSMPQGATSVIVPLVAGHAVQVRVLDRTQALPVRGATVDALNESGEVLSSGRTGGEGLADVTGLPDGSVLLRASWEPFCPGDPARVAVWSGAVRSAPFASLVPTDAGAEAVLRLPPDGDRDGMDDIWEHVYGLDPQRADGTGDPDQDGVVSLDEYLNYGDPLRGDDRLGCSVSRTAPTCWAFLSTLLALLGLGFVRRHPGR